MCPSSKPFAAVAVLLPTLLAAAPPQLRQGSSQIERGQRLIRGGFPELRDHSMHIMLRVETRYDDDWDKTGMIYFQLVPAGERSDRAEDLFLGGSLPIAAESGVNEDAFFKGTHLSSTVLYRLESDVEAHPEWSTADIAVLLAQAGARYGPNNATEFAKVLNVARVHSGTAAVADAMFSHFESTPSCSWS
jgi:hypothetical protein